MKKIILYLLATLTILSITACQATPETPIVVAKFDDSFQERLDKENEYVPYSAPVNLKETISNNNINLVIDANISVPKAPLPVVGFAPFEMTDEFAKNMINGFVGDAPLYSLYEGYTKSDIEAKIIEIKRVMSDPEYRFNTLDKDSDEYKAELKNYQDRIAMFEKMLEEAPEDRGVFEIERKFIKPVLDNRYAERPEGWTKSEDNGYRQISGYTEKNGKRNEDISFIKPASLFVGQSVNYRLNSYGGASDFTTTRTTDLKNCNLTIEQAIKTADDFMAKLGIKDMSLNLAGSSYSFNPKFDNDNTAIDDLSECYVFYYTRKVNDVPLTYQLVIPDYENQYAQFWVQEYIVMAVCDDGITQFSWISPSQTTETLSVNVELLPFEQIKSIVAKFAGIGLVFLDRDNGIIERDIHITDIVLGLSKVRFRGTSEYVVVPTWNLFGYEVSTYSEKQPGGYRLDENNQHTASTLGHSYLTINAVDGSIIDLSKGY